MVGLIGIKFRMTVSHYWSCLEDEEKSLLDLAIL